MTTAKAIVSTKDTPWYSLDWTAATFSPSADTSADAPSVISVTDNISFLSGGTAGHIGTWTVGEKKVFAGGLFLGVAYRSFMGLDNDIASRLNQISANTLLSKNAGQLSTAFSAATTKTDVLNYITNNNLTQGTGLTAQQFLDTVLPNLADTIRADQISSYITQPAEKYAQAKLTDNQVVQQQLTVLTSTRQALIESMTNLLKGWQEMLTTLGRSV